MVTVVSWILTCAIEKVSKAKEAKIVKSIFLIKRFEFMKVRSQITGFFNRRTTREAGQVVNKI